MFVQKCVLQGYQSLGFKLYLLLVKGIARPWPSQKWLLITIYDTLSTESVVFFTWKTSSPNKTKFTCLSFWSMFCPINALIFLQEKAYELLNRTRLVSFVSVLKLFLEIYWIFKFLSIKKLHIPTIMNKKRIKLWVWFFFLKQIVMFQKVF